MNEMKWNEMTDWQILKKNIISYHIIPFIIIQSIFDSPGEDKLKLKGINQ